MGGVDEINPTEKSKLFQAIFGKEPIRSLEDRIATSEQKIKASPFANKIGVEKMALPLAFGGVIGSVGLDLTPWGSLEKNAVKSLLKATTNEAAVSILAKMKIPSEVAAKYAPKFATTKTLDETKGLFDEMKSVINPKKPTFTGKETPQELLRIAEEKAKPLGLTTKQNMEDIVIKDKSSKYYQAPSEVLDNLMFEKRTLEKAHHTSTVEALEERIIKYAKENNLPNPIETTTPVIKTRSQLLQERDALLAQREMLKNDNAQKLKDFYNYKEGAIPEFGMTERDRLMKRKIRASVNKKGIPIKRKAEEWRKRGDQIIADLGYTEGSERQANEALEKLKLGEKINKEQLRQNALELKEIKNIPIIPKAIKYSDEGIPLSTKSIIPKKSASLIDTSTGEGRSLEQIAQQELGIPIQKGIVKNKSLDAIQKAPITVKEKVGLLQMVFGTPEYLFKKFGIEKIKKCFSSLYTPRAIYYREKRGFHKVKSFRAGPHHYGIIFTAP